MKNKFIAACLLAGILATTGVQAQNKKPTRSKTTREQSARSSGSNSSTHLSIESDSDVEKITYRKDGDDYKVWMLNGKILDLYLNNKKVEEADYPKYQTMFDEVMAKVKKDREQAAEHRLRAQEDRRNAAQHRRHPERAHEQDDRVRERAERDRERAERDRERNERFRDRLERDRERNEDNRDHIAHERARAQDERLNAEREHRHVERARLNAEGDRRRAEADRRRASDNLERADRNRRQAAQNRERAERNRERAVERRQRAEADRNMLNGLMDELVDAKVVGSRDDVRSMELTGESLIVNDKKQSTDLHKQLKDKYLKGDGNRIHFSQTSDGSRSFNIHRE